MLLCLSPPSKGDATHVHISSTIPVNMPHPNCIQPRSAQKWAQCILHTGLLLNWICLAKMWYAHPEPNRIWAQHDPGQVWKWETCNGLDAFCQNWGRRFLHTRSLPDQMHLAKTWPGYPGQIQAGFAQYDPGLQNRIRCGKSELAYIYTYDMIQPNSGCTWAVMAITKTLQNGSGMFTETTSCTWHWQPQLKSQVMHIMQMKLVTAIWAQK